jgi:hypothetical protein
MESSISVTDQDGCCLDWVVQIRLIVVRIWMMVVRNQILGSDVLNVRNLLSICLDPDPDSYLKSVCLSFGYNYLPDIYSKYFSLFMKQKF